MTRRAKKERPKAKYGGMNDKILTIVVIGYPSPLSPLFVTL